MRSPGDSAAAMRPAAHSAPVMGTAAEPRPTLRQDAAPKAAGAADAMSGMGGAVCLATPARGSLHPLVPLMLLVAFLVAGRTLLATLDGPAGRPASGLRPPPRSGRGLLLQVCVART